MRTAQQVFDTSVGALLAQHVRSGVDGGGYCMYRGPNGLKCAVGHLIPDEISVRNCEGEAITALIDARPDIAEFVLPCDWPRSRAAMLLRDLQHTHDNADPQDWREEFETLAASYKLQWNFD